MPSSEVMHKFKHGMLHSRSKKGPKVRSRDQAIAIMMSEKRDEEEGKGHMGGIGPTTKEVVHDTSKRRRAKVFSQAMRRRSR